MTPLFHIRSGARVIPVYQRDVDRFERYLSPEERWTGCVSGGYGMFGIGSRPAKTAVMVRAHVFQWARHHGLIIPEGFQIDHIDFDRLNLRPDNLRCIPEGVNAAVHAPGWTAKQQAVGRRSGTNSAGENHGNHTLADQTVAEIRAARASGLSLRSVAGQFGISFQHVSRIARGIARARTTPVTGGSGAQN